MKMGNLNIGSINNNAYSVDFLKQQKKNNIKSAIENGISDDFFINHKDEIQNYETSETRDKMLNRINKHLERKTEFRRIMRNEFEKGNDPAKAVIKQYFEYKDEINNSEISEKDRQNDLIILDSFYETEVRIFADFVYAKMSFSKSRNSQSLGPKRSLSLRKERYEQIKTDIVDMFHNAKDYYEKAGSFDGMTSEFISADSKTISYDDLLNLNYVLESMVENTESIYAKAEYETMIGVIDTGKKDSMINYINELINKLDMSSFSKGMLVDLFL